MSLSDETAAHLERVVVEHLKTDSHRVRILASAVEGVAARR